MLRNTRHGVAMTQAREKTADFLRNFFGLTPLKQLTAQSLCELIRRTLQLYPVALLAQMIGVGGLWTAYYEKIEIWFLAIWTFAWAIQWVTALVFVRRFWKDTKRIRKIRYWVKYWTILSIITGVFWGLTGVIFMVPYGESFQVLTVAILIGVTFASWPVYACWLPALTAFVLSSLVPLILALASFYQMSNLIINLMILIMTGFILYSGRKLNAMLVSSVLMDERNMRLLKRLKDEVDRSRRSRRATEEESARRARFFAAANHDLRQPLQAMGIYLDILDRRVDPKNKAVVQQISQTSYTISTLVEQILEVTRLEFGGLTPKRRMISLRTMFTRLEAEFKRVAAEKGFVFRIQCPDMQIETDEGMLRRSLRNLIGNAIHYSNPAHKKPEIVLAARCIRNSKGKDCVQLGVYDCGEGMTKEECKEIFRAFHRGSAGKAGRARGYGLGLSIVSGLTKLLKGRVSVSSRLGRGSVFRLTFPRDSHRVVLPRPSRTLYTNTKVQRMRGTILYLEDNRTLRNAVRSMMRQWGVRVIAFGEPNDAFFTTLQEHENDLIAFVSDYNLGEREMTGLEVAGLVESRLGHSVPIILLTAVALDSIQRDYRSHREQGDGLMPTVCPVILQKPVRASRLQQAILAREEQIQANLRHSDWSDQSKPM